MSGSEDEDEDDYYSGKLTCSSCGDETSMMRNVEDDIEEDISSLTSEQKLQRFTHDTCGAICLSCGNEMEPCDFPWVQKYAHYKVGLVLTVEVFKKKYQNLEIDIGEEEPLKVVTTGKVQEGQRVVVACVGALVPAGSDADDGAILVKKGSVGGKPSHGMLCDSPSLAWHGAKGVAAKISDVWPLGGIPPSSKQRPAGAGE